VTQGSIQAMQQCLAVIARHCTQSPCDCRNQRRLRCSSMSGTVPYPTISNIRDTLSSMLRSTVEADYLIKNPLDRLRMPLDKRPRQRKSTITPEQFHALLELVPKPFASMLFVSVWTGLRVSELIGLKWRCIHADSITVEERFCRGD
jgi:integrase